ncbi:MAG: VWA domain-containing protein [Actinomycetota bacterium]|nr:VWA domain-containing protein [Actinomycetota bacterium]
MSFGSPSWLLALVLLPVAIVAYVRAQRRARRYAIRFTALPSLKLAAGTTSSWQRHLPSALALLALAALAIALAKPRSTYRVALNQASIMLVTDHSGSMAATDVQPTRLAAAEQAANTFIDKLPSQVRVGAIAFSSSPDAVQGPVTSHGAARAIIDGQAANGATATGDALELALQLLRGANHKHPPSAIVLLSDGAANAGVNAVDAARQAGQDRIPVYTIALGTASGMLPNPDPLAPPVSVPPDPQLMQQIARVSGGRAFNAQSSGEVSSIYGRLGSQLGSVLRQHEITYEFAIAGLVLLLGAAAASARWSGRLP